MHSTSNLEKILVFKFLFKIAYRIKNSIRSISQAIIIYSSPNLNYNITPLNTLSYSSNFPLHNYLSSKLNYSIASLNIARNNDNKEVLAKYENSKDAILRELESSLNVNKLISRPRIKYD